jgi:aspartate aminotransferase-like enzyme
MTASSPPQVVDAQHYAAIEDRFAAFLGAPGLFLLQGEAMIPLEAVARSIGRPGSRALNIVTGPYGEGFGRWLAHQGVIVENLIVPFNRAVTPVEVRVAFSKETGFDIVSVVHAEAATGVVNQLHEIAALAHDAGALTVVDAVASVGAEPLDIQAWGLDVTVVSAQKALGGPAGVTGVAISDSAWAAIGANPSAPHDSVLSLLDWRDDPQPLRDTRSRGDDVITGRRRTRERHRATRRGPRCLSTRVTRAWPSSMGARRRRGRRGRDDRRRT